VGGGWGWARSDDSLGRLVTIEVGLGERVESGGANNVDFPAGCTGG
jgi:hypothetical protein